MAPRLYNKLGGLTDSSKGQVALDIATHRRQPCNLPCMHASAGGILLDLQFACCELSVHSSVRRAIVG